MALIYVKQKSKRKPKTSAKKRQLQSSWEELCRRYGVEPKKRRASTTFQPLTADPLTKALSLHADRNPYRAPSGPTTSGSVKVLKPKLRMTPEEAKRREAAAKLETERKRNRVAVLYNKGGLQYITDDADPKTFGRK